MSELYPNIPESAISDFEFVFQSTVFDMQRARLNELDKLINDINSCDNHKITLRMQDEVPPVDNGGFENLIEFIKTSPKDIRITVGSTSRFPFSLHPLVCFFNFYQIDMPKYVFDYTDGTTENVKRFPIEEYYVGKKLDSDKKTERGILSNRKSGYFREIVHDEINNSFKGTYRYVNYNLDNKYTKEDSDNFPTWPNLLKEYESSLVSFIMETEGLFDNFKPKYIINPITEKTPLAFMNFCIPIIFGNPNFLKELEDIGFWVANNDFGFIGGDEKIDNKIRIDKFINCINKFNSMTYKQLKIYYLDNIDKIQKNYDLASSVINNTHIQNNFPGYSNLYTKNLNNSII